MLDKDGGVLREIKRNITDEDFGRLIDDVSSMEGLIIDSSG